MNFIHILDYPTFFTFYEDLSVIIMFTLNADMYCVSINHD